MSTYEQQLLDQQHSVQTTEDLDSIRNWEEEMAGKQDRALELLGREATGALHIEVQGVVEPAQHVEVTRRLGHEIGPVGIGGRSV